MVDLQELQKLSRKMNTPYKVQKFLRNLKYNREEKGDTMRSALTAFKKKEAHCLEAALIAACLLEQNGYKPLVMSLESQDQLDHVIFIFKERTGWGAVGRSREQGLHGREPRHKNLKSLALSYVEPFIDKTGRITGFGVAKLDDSKTRWRDSSRNLWSLEKFLIDLRHQKLKTSDQKYLSLLQRFQETKLTIQKGPGWW